MLQHYLAAGVFTDTSDSSSVVTPPRRTVILQPGSSLLTTQQKPTALQPLDPSGGLLDYTADLSVLLDSDDSVALATAQPSLVALAAGLVVSQVPGLAPTLVTPTTLLMWCSITPSAQSSTQFNGNGISLGVEVTVTTVKGRIEQATMYVLVVNL